MKSGAKACAARLLNCERADAAVIEQIRESVLTEDHFGDLIRMVNEELVARNESAEGEIRTVEGQLAEARRALEILYKHIENETLTVEDLRPRLRHWRARSDELMARQQILNERRRSSPDVAIDESIITAYLAGLRDLLERGSVAERRAFLRGWIRRIEVRGRDLTIVYAFPRWPGDRGPAGSGGRGGIIGKGPRSRGGAPGGGTVLFMDKSGSPGLTIGRTWEIEVVVPVAREAMRKVRKRRQRRRARKQAEPGRLRGPERWREWQQMLDEGVYPTKAALARGEGVSRAAVTLGLPVWCATEWTGRTARRCNAPAGFRQWHDWKWVGR